MNEYFLTKFVQFLVLLLTQKHSHFHSFDWKEYQDLDFPWKVKVRLPLAMMNPNLLYSGSRLLTNHER